MVTIVTVELFRFLLNAVAASAGLARGTDSGSSGNSRRVARGNEGW